MEWEEAKARIDRWHRAHAEGPAPDGYKRCMNCYEVMDWGEYCKCMKQTGEEIRAKAIKECSLQLVKEKETQKRTQKKEKKDQGRLF